MQISCSNSKNRDKVFKLAVRGPDETIFLSDTLSYENKLDVIAAMKELDIHGYLTNDNQVYFTPRFEMAYDLQLVVITNGLCKRNCELRFCVCE